VEFVIAAVGVVLAGWMILSARRRHREDPSRKQDPDA
jgi:hypothetical protein